MPHKVGIETYLEQGGGAKLLTLFTPAVLQRMRRSADRAHVARFMRRLRWSRGT